MKARVRFSVLGLVVVLAAACSSPTLPRPTPPDDPDAPPDDPPVAAFGPVVAAPVWLG